VGSKCVSGPITLIALLTEDPPVPYAQISARLGIPVGSIGPCRGRCLDKLRRHPAVAALINAHESERLALVGFLAGDTGRRGVGAGRGKLIPGPCELSLSGQHSGRGTRASARTRALVLLGHCADQPGHEMAGWLP
jgi:hypothetical protein